MELILDIVSFSGEKLPANSPINVEIRDTSLADAPAVLLKRLKTIIPSTGTTLSMPLTLNLDSVPKGTTVWVHVDIDGDGRVSLGDLITVESYPVKLAPTQTLTVRVKEVK